MNLNPDEVALFFSEFLNSTTPVSTWAGLTANSAPPPARPVSVPLSEIQQFFQEEQLVFEGMSAEAIRSIRAYSGVYQDCSICISHTQEGLQLDCGHIFHTECITRWLQRRSQCPNCRREP